MGTENLKQKTRYKENFCNKGTCKVIFLEVLVISIEA